MKSDERKAFECTTYFITKINVSAYFPFVRVGFGDQIDADGDTVPRVSVVMLPGEARELHRMLGDWIEALKKSNAAP